MVTYTTQYQIKEGAPCAMCGTKNDLKRRKLKIQGSTAFGSQAKKSEIEIVCCPKCDEKIENFNSLKQYAWAVVLIGILVIIGLVLYVGFIINMSPLKEWFLMYVGTILPILGLPPLFICLGIYAIRNARGLRPIKKWIREYTTLEEV